MNIKPLVLTRWFGVFDLFCVLICVFLWETKLDSGWLPLCIALIPWLIRLIAGYFPFKRTSIDGFIGLFILTAGVGVWTAYNPGDAWSKFWLILGSVFLFYALAGQPHENQWLISWFLGLIGASVSVYFLLTQNWQLNPAKIGVLNQIGLLWMKVRPSFNIGSIDHDNAAGIIALSVPFFIMIWVKSWREKRLLAIMGAALGSLMVFAGYLMATSRSASIALFAGISIGILWTWLTKSNLNIFVHNKNLIISIFIFLILFFTAGFILIFDNSIHLFSGALTFSDASTRPVLIRSTIELIKDFFLTGSGLNTFPGLYSHYVLGIPFFYIQNSRNLFLDIGLEQGIFGLLAILGIYLRVFWLLLKQSGDSAEKWFTGGVVACFSIILLNNVIEDTLYSQGVTPLLLILPGIACITIMSNRFPVIQEKEILVEKKKVSLSLIFISLLSVFIIGIIIGFRKSILAAWYADLGSIQMARLELFDFPSGHWDSGQNTGKYNQIEAEFNHALQYEPDNETANFRLGLISMDKRDFQAAVKYLSNAYKVDSGNRGVIKMLGYSYTWSEEFDQAEPLLNQISESKQELDTYAWWWNSQGRSDLALDAKTMGKRLE